MEEGSQVWLRSPKSEWGWLPARITRKETVPKPKKHKDVGSSAVINGRRGGSASTIANGTSNKNGSSSAASSSSSSADSSANRKAAMLKQLDDARRKELQSIMRDRSLAKDERKKRMDEVKDRYATLVSDAENSPTPPPELEEPISNGSSGGGSGADDNVDQPSSTELRPEDTMIQLTLVDDFTGLEDSTSTSRGTMKDTLSSTSGYGRGVSGYYAKMSSFKEIINIDTLQARDE